MNSSKDIFLNKDKNPEFKDYTLFSRQGSIEVLPNFNVINILVGSNNSGKSRFMRALMKEQKILAITAYDSLLNKIETSNDLIKSLDINWKKNRNVFSTNPDPIMSQANEINIRPFNFINSQYFLENVKTQFENQILYLELAEKIISKSLVDYFLRSQTDGKIAINEDFKRKLRITIDLIKEIVTDYEIDSLGNNLNYFIPTLRTAHSLFEVKEISEFSKVKKDIFLDTLLKNYKFSEFVSLESVLKEENDESKIKKTYIFTGLNLYNQIVNARNGSKAERRRFEEFEKFIGKEFFNTEAIDIVAQFNIVEKHQNRDDNEIINISIDGNDGLKLHDLGDGIQSLIILMYSIFMAPENTVIYIDEPELNLHPGMQRLFLEQITNNIALTEKKLIYVIATHSNHLLDLTIEKDNVSVFSFTKSEENKHVIKNVNVGDNELLRELGVNNSSVFLSNSSLWVEGISDRNYVKAFLIAYCNEFSRKEFPKEDIDFAFLEYAGSNLSHYDFNFEDNENINAYALNNRILILADNDLNKEDKHKKYRQFCEINPQNLEYISTKPYREIENLLSEEIWQKILIDLCDQRKVKSDRVKIQDSIKMGIANNRIGDFKDKYIGEYLKALNIPTLNKVYDILGEEPKSLKSEYKTVLSKLVLDKTISKEFVWANFSKNNKVKVLTESIYSFIMKKK